MRRCVVVWCCQCVARRQVPNASVPFHSLPFLSQHLGLDAQKGPGQQRHPITNFNERESNTCSNCSQCFDPAPQTCSVRSKSLRNKYVKPPPDGREQTLVGVFPSLQSNWGTHTHTQPRGVGVGWLSNQIAGVARHTVVFPALSLSLPGKQLRAARRRITHRRLLGGEGLQQCGRESTRDRDGTFCHFIPSPGESFFFPFRWFQCLVPKLCAGR